MENEDGCCWFIAIVTIFTPFTSFVPIKDMKKVQKNSLATCVADYRIQKNYESHFTTKSFFLHLRLINWCMIVATQIIILHTWESMRQDETSFLYVTINLVFDKYFNPGKCLFWFRLVEQGVVLFCQTKQLERPLRVFLLPLCIQNKHNHPKTHLAVHFLCFCGWGLFIAK